MNGGCFFVFMIDRTAYCIAAKFNSRVGVVKLSALSI